jgi:hypothetical protein
MTERHLLFWVFKLLRPEDIEKLCSCEERMPGDNVKMTVGEMFRERRDAYWRLTEPRGRGR